MVYLLHQTIERAARRYSERTAFRCGKRSLTFGDLEAQANSLAHHLIGQGIERGDRIGIYLPRCVETAIAVYGILKAGAAYVPLAPNEPTERIGGLIADCGIRIVISDKRLRRQQSALAESGVAFIDCQVEGPSGSPEVRILESDLAYIMYTSGSTGAPKGIMHTHASGLAYARLSAQLYGLSTEDIVGNHCALHYDISTFGYFSAPLVGATTVIVSDAHTKFPVSLLQLLETERITVWYSVPLALLQIIGAPNFDSADLSALRWILFGGEVFAPRHLRRLMQAASNALASNVYGPAEINQCTYYHLSEPPVGDDPIPLGYIWDNTEGLVLDTESREVAPGEIGELVVRSATMMRGYWRRPDLTEKAFFYRERTPGIPDVFYRTGDLVRQDGAGRLIFMGRKDRQIKTRGYRVELEAVEALLNAHEAVAEGAVYAIEPGEEGKVIEAMVVPKTETNAAAILQHLAQSLPEHALPRRIQFVNSLPRSSAGKIDRLAIAAAVAEKSY